VLVNYSWPGNGRELRLAVERACRLVENGSISPSAVAEAIELGSPRSLRRERRVRARRSPLGDRARFVAVCGANGWHAGRIAAALGIGRSTLFYRLKAEGLSLPELRQSKESNSESWTRLD
jgi:transcriptional regulator of acetoin/glycerol metabolism